MERGKRMEGPRREADGERKRERSVFCTWISFVHHVIANNVC